MMKGVPASLSKAINSVGAQLVVSRDEVPDEAISTLLGILPASRWSKMILSHVKWLR